MLARARSLLLPLIVAVVLPGLLWGLVPFGAAAQDGDEQSLRDGIASSRDRESRLSGAAARLARLERGAARAVARIEARQAEVQTQLDRAQARLQGTVTAQIAQRERALRLRTRLTGDREQLAAVLRADYVQTDPDLVTVLTEVEGFNDLLTRVEFTRTVQRANAAVIAAVRSGRRNALRQRRTLTTLAAAQRRAALDVRRERDAIAQMTAAAQQRRAALAQARAARQQALSTVRGNRKRAERTLKRLLKAQAKAAVDKRGPGGPWAIPWAIVQCESGGQNLGPNFVGASGYYQFIPSTWKGLGGSTPHAYLASKAEQDRLAARLWAGGRGARNWDCAAMVGLL